jgi:hypothetical protein
MIWEFKEPQRRKKTKETEHAGTEKDAERKRVRMKRDKGEDRVMLHVQSLELFLSSGYSPQIPP